MNTHDLIDVYIDEAQDSYPLVGIYRTRDRQIELTMMDTDVCAGCGQSIPIVNPGRDRWIDQRTGETIGSYSHQHGCGEWNAPVSMLVDLDPDGGEFNGIDDQIRDAITKLRDEVSESVERENGRIRARLLRVLREVRNEIKRIKADQTLSDEDRDWEIEDQLTGNDLYPGVYYDGDLLVAWDWDAAPGEGDTISVSEDDLADDQAAAATS